MGSASGFNLALIGGGPGVGRIGCLTVVDLLVLAPPQAPPLFVHVAVCHVTVQLGAWMGRERQERECNINGVKTKEK